MRETTSILPDSEQFLIKGCIAGDRHSQAKLYNTYARKMMGLCMWYARNREEAEEILQDGFIRVFTYLHKYSGSGSFEGWIRKIMVNTALLRFRNKSHLQPVVEFDTDFPEPPGNNSILRYLDAKELVELVQMLSPGYRIVFNLHVLEGMKHREIAAALGISEGTSKSNLAAARVNLQKMVTSNEKMAVL